MLYESQVLDAMERHFPDYSVEFRAPSHGRGIDRILRRGKIRLLIEGKGGMNSRPGPHLGRAFSNGQMKDHAMKAVYWAVAAREANPADEVAIALWKCEAHKQILEKVGATLQKLKIDAYFIDDSRRVQRFDRA